MPNISVGITLILLVLSSHYIQSWVHNRRIKVNDHTRLAQNMFKDQICIGWKNCLLGFRCIHSLWEEANNAEHLELHQNTEIRTNVKLIRALATFTIGV